MRRAFVAVRLIAAVAVLRRLVRGAQRPAPLHAEVIPPDVTVVVPARNEAQRIAGCIAPLRAAGVPVIVVDDESDDETAAVAGALGASVLIGAPRPRGWAGKTWALQQGITAATTQWVVCLDADTRPDPGLLGALVASATGSDLCTAGGTFVCETTGEQMLHPAMLASLVYRFGPPTGDVQARPHANGQCMVFDRAKFLAQGGMEPVAGSLIEDMALARVVHARNGVVRFVDASPLLAVRMHENVREVWQHWGRSLAVAEDAPWHWRIADLVVLWTTMALPLPRVLFRRGDFLDVVLLLLRAITAVGTSSVYKPRRWTYWCSPLADIAVAWRCTKTTIWPERTWRGRTYDAPERR
ncbi:MAG: glycosyltransferase [Acidimicrobiia bacterium]